MKIIASIALTASVLLSQSAAQANTTIVNTGSNAKLSFTDSLNQTDISRIINFLTATTEQVGLTYQGNAGDLKGLKLPLSYYSTPSYWGNYVCKVSGNNCTVNDVFSSDDYTLLPSENSPGAKLQTERVNAFDGANIYDAATWQIAIALAATNGIKGASFTLADNENTLLAVGYDGNATNPAPNANRALTQIDGTFTYNGNKITDPRSAYFFRSVTRNWLSTDPLMGTSFSNYITASNLPTNNSEYRAGKISWSDWKPITGENAWGFLVGPLQAAYLQYKVANNSFVPFKTAAVQNALQMLPTFSRMQSPLGGIYYSIKGSVSNDSNALVNPYEVSTENNASALAGLLIFQQILQQELVKETTLNSAQKALVQNALKTIDIMINGGQSPNGYSTHGLLSYFKNNAWDPTSGTFVQGGIANDPTSGKEWIPTLEPKAVDVNTWGVSVLGQPLIDGWFGYGTAYNIWQNVKQWGGYYGPDNQLWGVGYSNFDNARIFSGEWTAGAINMVRGLIVQYQVAGDQQKVASLQQDEANMMRYFMTLRTDRYATEPAFANDRPDNYNNLIAIPNDKLAFIYANKRYFIPFGWFANPIPSTASTSWAVMLFFKFNPLGMNGTYSANFLQNGKVNFQ